jgi:hypothetical protein
MCVYVCTQIDRGRERGNTPHKHRKRPPKTTSRFQASVTHVRGRLCYYGVSLVRRILLEPSSLRSVTNEHTPSLTAVWRPLFVRLITSETPLPCCGTLIPLNSIQQAPYTSLIEFITAGREGNLKVSRNFIRSIISRILTELFVSWHVLQNFSCF